MSVDVTHDSAVSEHMGMFSMDMAIALSVQIMMMGTGVVAMRWGDCLI
jgi:hypothetical protein